MGSELPAGSRWGARLLVLAACPAFAALGFYLAGNGLTRAGAALASLPIGCLSGAAILHRKKRHLAGVILGLTVLLALAYIHQRLQQTEPQKAALTFCEQGRCGGAPPLLTRLATEGETAMAGMALTSFFRMIEEPEKSELTRLLRISYSEQEQNPPWNALPNTPLMSLLDREGRYQLWMPTGVAKPPCIVFLHGFGGQLTAYLHALIEGGLGADFAIVAPLGGPIGYWWSEDERQRLLRLLDHLPPSIDPTRVSLVGLSNGAVGAAKLAEDRRFHGKFYRVVALSGGSPIQGSPLTPPILFLTGNEDPRFPVSWVKEAHEHLLAQGAQSAFVGIPGDHFIILSQKAKVTAHIREWLR